MMASSWGVRVGCADLITKYLVFSRRFVNSQLPTPKGNLRKAAASPHGSRGSPWELGVGGWQLRSSEFGQDRCVIARPQILLDHAAADRVEDPLTRQDVVEAPADVALAHVAPWRPPREELIVVGLEGAAGVDQTVADYSFEQRTLLRELPDDARLALLGMHVHVGARDVEVAADDHRRGARLETCGVGLEIAEEPHLRVEVLAAVRHVNRNDGERRQAHLHHAVLVVERGM